MYDNKTLTLTRQTLVVQLYALIYSPQLAQQYGDVYSVRLGGDKIVFVCGYKMVKEAIVTQADNFVDRPYSPLNEKLYMGDKGL